MINEGREGGGGTSWEIEGDDCLRLWTKGKVPTDTKANVEGGDHRHGNHEDPLETSTEVLAHGPLQRENQPRPLVAVDGHPQIEREPLQ